MLKTGEEGRINPECKKWTLPAPLTEGPLERGEKRDNAIDSDDPDSVLPPLQIGEQVELVEEEETESETDEEETKQVQQQCKDGEGGRMKEEEEEKKGGCRGGRVEDVEWVPYAVLDFMDGTVSRDIPSNDIVDHSCDDCTPPMHTAGAVVSGHPNAFI